MNAQEQAKLDEQYRKEAREQQRKRIEAGRRRREGQGRVPGVVNAAKECGDTYKKCREAFERPKAAGIVDQWLVEKEQKAPSSRSTSPADVAEYCADAKKARPTPRSSRIRESIRRLGKSPDLMTRRCCPGVGGVH